MLLYVYTYDIMCSQLEVQKNSCIHSADVMIVSGLCTALYL
jgi:hypothetical protein